MKTFLEGDRIRRLLIRGTNWVGDSVMAIPALREVRQLLPRAHITLLVLPWVGDIYQGSPWVDAVWLYDREGRHAGTAGRLRLVRELARGGFDAALLLQNAFEAALLTRLARIPLRAGYRRDGRGWLLTHAVSIDPRLKARHQTCYYLDLVERLAGRTRSLDTPSPPPHRTTPELPLPPEARAQARRQLKEEGIRFKGKVIGVHPGAAFGSAKRWIGDRYAQVLDRLILTQGTEAILFGSRQERPIAESICRHMSSRPLVLSGRTRLSELIAMIACCDLFITNDSGPMHLAAALGIPTLALFGSTDQVATGPLGPAAVVLNKNVECSPCLLRECPIDHRCMTRITVEEVFQEAVRMLRAGG